MRQGIACVLVCSVLAGCAAPNNGSWWDGWGYLASAEAEHQFDFSWALTGNNQLAPLQVFSNTKQVWLQFPSDSYVPALFTLRRDGTLVPVQAQPQGIYHVVNESVDVLLLRRGAEEAWAYRTVSKPLLLSYLQKQQTLLQRERTRQSAQSYPDAALRHAALIEPVQAQGHINAPSESEKLSRLGSEAHARALPALTPHLDGNGRENKRRAVADLGQEKWSDIGSASIGLSSGVASLSRTQLELGEDRDQKQSGKHYVKNVPSSKTTPFQAMKEPTARVIHSERQSSALPEPASATPAQGSETTGELAADAKSLPSSASAQQQFASLSSDKSLKQLIQRWAHDAAWVFNDEHWAVNVEIPLSGPFTHQGSFPDVVQQVLLSTQLGDYPLRPCFYSNNVLRVIPFEESCLALRVLRGER